MFEIDGCGSMGIGRPIETKDHARQHLQLRERQAWALLGMAETNGKAGDSGVARLIAAILLLTLLPGWTDTRGIVRVDRASPDKPYDFVVHVRNIPDIKYNPLVREDRNRMALELVRGECARARVVGEDKIITEIWGLTSSPPDYVVLVSCAGKMRKAAGAN
jgi:hypothetical protein